jgi:hypothetical protein
VFCRSCSSGSCGVRGRGAPIFTERTPCTTSAFSPLSSLCVRAVCLFLRHSCECPCAVRPCARRVVRAYFYNRSHEQPRTPLRTNAGGKLGPPRPRAEAAVSGFVSKYRRRCCWGGVARLGMARLKLARAEMAHPVHSSLGPRQRVTDFNPRSHVDFGDATHPVVGGGTHHRRATRGGLPSADIGG